MNIPKENLDNEVLKKYAPTIVTAIGVESLLVASEINKKRQEMLANAYSQTDACFELYKKKVKRNRSIFYRVKKFFKRLFRK